MRDTERDGSRARKMDGQWDMHTTSKFKSKRDERLKHSNKKRISVQQI